MGLFSRKNPEEKKAKKFNKLDNKLSKNGCYTVYCPLFQLYGWAFNEEQYRKIADYYTQWVFNNLEEAISKIKFWGDIKFWNNFHESISCGLISLMLLGEYEECVKCCDTILDLEELLFSKKISRNSGFVLSLVQAGAAAAGAGGHEKQEQLLQKVKLFKAFSLCESGKEPMARLMLKEFPDNYALIFKKDDDYFNDHFKHKDNFSVQYLKSVLQE